MTTAADARWIRAERAAEARSGGRYITKALSRFMADVEDGRLGTHLVDTLSRRPLVPGLASPESLSHLWDNLLSPAAYGPETSRQSTAAYARSLAKGYDATARSVFLNTAETMLDWPIYRAAMTRQAAEPAYVEGSMRAANDAAENLRLQLPVILGTAMGKAEARFNEVFEDKSARGRFREGMSIAQGIYRRALNDTFDLSADQLEILTRAAGEARYADES